MKIGFSGGARLGHRILPFEAEDAQIWADLGQDRTRRRRPDDRGDGAGPWRDRRNRKRRRLRCHRRAGGGPVLSALLREEGRGRSWRLYVRRQGRLTGVLQEYLDPFGSGTRRASEGSVSGTEGPISQAWRRGGSSRYAECDRAAPAEAAASCIREKRAGNRFLRSSRSRK